MANPILALDLGKFNTVLCWFDPDTKATTFRTTPTSPDDLRRELTRQPAALVECAWCSLRYNAWARGVWVRLQRNGLSKKKAIVALARKLLVVCWAMLRTGQAWRVSVEAEAATV